MAYHLLGDVPRKERTQFDIFVPEGRLPEKHTLSHSSTDKVLNRKESAWCSLLEYLITQFSSPIDIEHHLQYCNREQEFEFLSID